MLFHPGKVSFVCFADSSSPNVFGKCLNLGNVTSRLLRICGRSAFTLIDLISCFLQLRCNKLSAAIALYINHNHSRA